MNKATTRSVFSMVCIACAISWSLAAPPQNRMNYQGVLRDAADQPIDGTRDMVFRFFDAAIGGDEILVDSHTAGVGAGVSVDGGLFNVELGGGAVADGAGPGSYFDLGEVFREHATVWLELEIGGELLSPRVEVLAAAYAMNAQHLQGRVAADFLDTSTTGQIKSGPLVVDSAVNGWYGVDASGVVGGGRFQDIDGSGYAMVGASDLGINAGGVDGGGYFVDTDGSGYAYVGRVDTGVFGHGNLHGGYFENRLDGSNARLGFSGEGIHGYGPNAGGYFADFNDTAFTWVARGNTGIEGNGTLAGGIFNNTAYSSYAQLGLPSYGALASGPSSGGFFLDADASGQALVGVGDDGIRGFGTSTGGYFSDTDSSGYAYAGYGNYGVYALGNSMGGYFKDRDNSGYAYAGASDFGVQGYGNLAGGYFNDLTSGTYAYLGYGSQSIWGNGTKNFVQNHPEDPAKVIVYTAPEGDEVATYTRGTARLVDGEARVALGESFRWVTNPDLGLTAHLTPRGGPAELYVVELTPEELIVRGTKNAGDVGFDYLVFGLRIGFEEHPVVTPKVHAAPIPSMAVHQQLYAAEPALRAYTALERFRGMAEETGQAVAQTDRAGQLAARIGVWDAGSVASEFGGGEPGQVIDDSAAVRHDPPGRVAAGGTEDTRSIADSPAPFVADGLLVRTDAATPRRAASRDAASSDAWRDAAWLPVGEAVEPGDVLVFDPSGSGRLVRGTTIADPAVAGVAVEVSAIRADAAESAQAGVVVAVSGIAEMRVDASYGEIRVGDLLTTSATPGHAMRAHDVRAGTILGKAAEALPTGTGTIRVLLMPR